MTKFVDNILWILAVSPNKVSLNDAGFLRAEWRFNRTRAPRLPLSVSLKYNHLFYINCNIIMNIFLFISCIKLN